jgi:glycosyltransferase involved in cell wall biosynthesis
MSTHVNHYLIFDPIAFLGGSKIATREALSLTNKSKTRFTILTADKGSWDESYLSEHHDVSLFHLPALRLLARVEQGKLYWVKQCIYMVFVFITLLRVTKVSGLVGTSGPGVDMSLYLIKRLTNITVIQFIHGPVAISRSIGYCLTIADTVFYLASAKNSLCSAMSHYFSSQRISSDVDNATEQILQSDHYVSFQNGLTTHNWPTRAQYHSPTLFWCASLLKWKGLDLLIEASTSIRHLCPVNANICFIRPVDTSLPVSTAPVSLAGFSWYQQPSHLDEIRCQSNIFVSTSYCEPFGLSILEAMAAGMCVIIPADGAYWDRVLTHNLNCIKYVANDANSLANTLANACGDVELCERLGNEAYSVAQQYRAEKSYHDIIVRFNQSDPATLSHTLGH